MHTRHEDGMYHISGHKYSQLEGSRAQVYHGTAHHTSGGLQKKDIKMNKWNRLVSKAKSMKAKKENRLEKSGFFATKGQFGVVKKEASECRGKSAKKCRKSSGCKYVSGKSRKYCRTAKSRK
jgi:hypothetical protein